MKVTYIKLRLSVPNNGVALVSKAISRVSPLGWVTKPEIILIDQALNEYETVWAAAGHPHAVYPTSFSELLECTGAQPMVVGE